MPDPGWAVDARELASGDLEAVFLPARGMLGASVRHRGEEILRRVGNLEAAAAKGSTAGIPLLHPWANRLDGLRYRAAGRDVALDPASPLLHFDARGLPIHGVPWSRLSWKVTAESPGRLAAGLDWDREDLLSIFPFRHGLEMVVALAPDGLTLETTLVPGPEGPVPVSFGFHPYLGIPGVPRAEWRLGLPAMRRLVQDAHGIPDGREVSFAAEDALLRSRAFDDGFALESDRASFLLSGGGRRVVVDLLEGYRFAQIYAPPGEDLIAIEPMTAPTNALASGRGLGIVGPGERFRAVFRIGVEG